MFNMQPAWQPTRDALRGIALEVTAAKRCLKDEVKKPQRRESRAPNHARRLKGG